MPTCPLQKVGPDIIWSFIVQASGTVHAALVRTSPASVSLVFTVLNEGMWLPWEPGVNKTISSPDTPVLCSLIPGQLLHVSFCGSCLGSIHAGVSVRIHTPSRTHTRARSSALMSAYHPEYPHPHIAPPPGGRGYHVGSAFFVPDAPNPNTHARARTHILSVYHKRP